MVNVAGDGCQVNCHINVTICHNSVTHTKMLHVAAVSAGSYRVLFGLLACLAAWKPGQAIIDFASGFVPACVS